MVRSILFFFSLFLLRTIKGSLNNSGGRNRFGRSRFGRGPESLRQEPLRPGAGFVATGAADRHNSEWHVLGLLPLRSCLSAGPGHPAVIQDSAIGLGTTQIARRLPQLGMARLRIAAAPVAA